MIRVTVGFIGILVLVTERVMKRSCFEHTRENETGIQERKRKKLAKFVWKKKQKRECGK